jgi:hypothetical protein
MLREVPWLVVSDSNFTSNGRLPKEPKAAAADDDEEEEDKPSTATFGGALGVGWRGGDSPDRNVTLLKCRCVFRVEGSLFLYSGFGGCCVYVNERTSQATAGYHTSQIKKQKQQQQQQQ